MNAHSIRLLCVLMFLTFFGGCETTRVFVPEGPKAAELAKAKDAQIAGLVAQVKAEQEARELEQTQAALVAANLEGVLFAAQHVPTGLPRTAIEEEAKLGRERGPAPNPVELLKAKDRVIAILNGEVEKARALYDAEKTAAAKARAEIEAKDAEIVKRDKEIETRGTEIARLTTEAQAEREKHVNDIKKLVADHQAEIQRLKDEQASKERAQWVLWTRIAGIGLIVAGAIALAVFKMAGVGGGLVGAGVLVGLISLGIEALTNAWWFPYLAGGVFLVVCALGCYGIYRLWIMNTLDDKKTRAIQDMIDEATLKGDTKTVDELKAHLNYRLGDSKTFWGKRQKDQVAALGLIDPKGEEALKNQAPQVDKTA